MSAPRLGFRAVRGMTDHDRLQAFRIGLAYDQRNAQMWALWKFRKMSHSEIGHDFGVTRARAQQICSRAEGLLADWPSASEWHETLPLRLRELCRLNGYRVRADLLRALMAETSPRHFACDDLREARRVLGIQFENGADRTLEALHRVLDALDLMRSDIETLCKSEIVGSRALRRTAATLKMHGQAVFEELQRDAAVAAATIGARPSSTDPEETQT